MYWGTVQLTLVQAIQLTVQGVPLTVHRVSPTVHKVSTQYTVCHLRIVGHYPALIAVKKPFGLYKPRYLGLLSYGGVEGGGEGGGRRGGSTLHAH